MRKISIVILTGMLSLYLGILSFPAYAQTSLNCPGLKIASWQVNLSSRYESEVQRATVKNRDRTDPGYYKKMYGTKGALVIGRGASLRTTDDCSQIVCASAAPLPVTVISFNGERIDANQVSLNWETTSETNNAGFDIERSLNTPSGFEKVGFVDGSGNTTSTKTYQFPDQNSSEEIAYYRLKQLDYDGTFMYSRIIAIDGFKEQLSLLPVPNPGSQVSSFLQVKGNDNSGKIQLTVVDMKGALVYKNDQFVLGNNKQIPLSTLPELTTGLYIAKIVSGDQHSTISFVIAER